MAPRVVSVANYLRANYGCNLLMPTAGDPTLWAILNSACEFAGVITSTGDAHNKVASLCAVCNNYMLDAGTSCHSPAVLCVLAAKIVACAKETKLLITDKDRNNLMQTVYKFQEYSFQTLNRCPDVAFSRTFIGNISMQDSEHIASFVREPNAVQRKFLLKQQKQQHLAFGVSVFVDVQCADLHNVAKSGAALKTMLKIISSDTAYKPIPKALSDVAFDSEREYQEQLKREESAWLELQRHIENLERQSQDFKENLRVSDQALQLYRSWVSKVEKLRGVEKDSNTKLTAKNKKLTEKITKLETKKEELKTKKEELKTQKKKLETQLAEKETKLKTLQEIIKNREAQVAKLQKELAEAKKLLSESVSKTTLFSNRNNKTIKNLKQKLEKAQKSVLTSQSQAVLLRNQKRALDDAFSIAVSETMKMETKNAQLSNDLQKCQEMLEKKAEAKNLCNEKLKEWQELGITLKEEKLQIFNRFAEKIRSQADKHKKEKKNYDKRLKTLSKISDAHENNVFTLQKRVEKRDADIRNLKAKLEAASKTTLPATGSAVSGNTQRADKLAQTVAELQGKVEILQDQHTYDAKQLDTLNQTLKTVKMKHETEIQSIHDNCEETLLQAHTDGQNKITAQTKQFIAQNKKLQEEFDRYKETEDANKQALIEQATDAETQHDNLKNHFEKYYLETQKEKELFEKMSKKADDEDRTLRLHIAKIEKENKELKTRVDDAKPVDDTPSEVEGDDAGEFDSGGATKPEKELPEFKGKGYTFDLEIPLKIFDFNANAFTGDFSKKTAIRDKQNLDDDKEKWQTALTLEKDMTYRYHVYFLKKLCEHRLITIKVDKKITYVNALKDQDARILSRYHQNFATKFNERQKQYKK